jgi:hypothetical protein
MADGRAWYERGVWKDRLGKWLPEPLRKHRLWYIKTKPMPDGWYPRVIKQADRWKERRMKEW